MKDTEQRHNAIDKALEELTDTVSLNEVAAFSVDAIANAVMAEYHLQKELNDTGDIPVRVLKRLGDKVFALCEIAKANLRIAEASIR